MLLIKLGGSLIAPKHTHTISTQYVKDFYQIIKKYPSIIVHGTGNVGHWFINQYGLSTKTWHIGREILDTYFNHIDTLCDQHQRLYYNTQIDRKNIPDYTIISWDITTDCKIISSDAIFAEILANKDISLAIMVTDVDGVLDQNNNIIPLINQQNIDTIHFRQKPWDVTGSMQEKITQLIQHNKWSNKQVWICNGNYLVNIEQILNLNQGIWTQILL